MKENESVSVIALVGIFFRLKCVYCFGKKQYRISTSNKNF